MTVVQLDVHSEIVDDVTPQKTNITNANHGAGIFTNIYPINDPVM